MKTRFGSFVRDLLRFPGLTDHEFSYPRIPNDVMFTNDNTFILSGICKETNLLVLNSLKTRTNHFMSNKTYGKGTEWTSELYV